MVKMYKIHTTFGVHLNHCAMLFAIAPQTYALKNMSMVIGNVNYFISVVTFQRLA